MAQEPPVRPSLLLLLPLLLSSLSSLSNCSTTPLLLASMILAGLTGGVSSQTDIYVTGPAGGFDNSSCWDGGPEMPCATVAWALQGLLNTSSATRHPAVLIEAGTHELAVPLVFSGEEWPYLANIHIVGLPGNDSQGTLAAPDVTISCSSDSQSGFAFLSVKDGIMLENVCLQGCGTTQISTSTINDTFIRLSTAVYFLFCENIVFRHVWVIHSSEAGVVVYASKGTNTFTNCSFSYNPLSRSHSSIPGGGGGFYLEFPYCSPNLSYDDCKASNGTNILSEYVTGASFLFEGCTFAENNNNGTVNISSTAFVIPGGYNHMALGRGGGLSVYFKGDVRRCNVTILDCDFVSNTALWGGGFLTEFQDNSQNNILSVSSSRLKNNAVLHDIAHNKGTGGGGVRVGYIMHGDSQRTKYNSMVFSDCHFEGNKGYFGGGMSFYVAREQSEITATNTLQFSDCSWSGNAARLGAAGYLSVWHPVTKGAPVETKFINTTVCCHGKESNLQQRGYLVGIGAMYIDSLPVVFEGSVVFHHNSHTALAATDAQIEFHRGCNVEFTHNAGRHGGAMALLGSTFFRAFRESNYSFIDNSAAALGGAIYSSTLGERNLVSSRSCFIRYENITADPHHDWDVRFVFLNNSDSVGNISIYASSLIPCVWGGATGPYDPASVNDTFCWNSTVWSYDTRCGDAVASAPVEFVQGPSQGQLSLTAFPGEHMQLNITMLNDLEVDASQFMVLTPSPNEGAAIDFTPNYISYPGRVQLLGESGTYPVSLYTLAPGVVYTVVEITLRPCPPGFNSTSNTSRGVCQCKQLYPFNNIVSCSNSSGHLSLRLIVEGAWIGYTNVSSRGTRELLAGFTPYGFVDASGLSFNTFDLLQDEHSSCSPHHCGKLCAQCEQDFGPSINSWALECVLCNSTIQTDSVIGYVFLELVPLTVVFMVLLLFNVRLTSGPANAFIFFSQTITATFGLYYVHTQRYRKLIRAWVIVYSVWNLRFQEIIPNYCLSDDFKFASVIALEYISAIYPLILIVVFYIGTSLYSHGVQPVLCLCRPLHHCVARLRLNTLQRTISDALAAFILLSYTKFTIVSLRLLSPSQLYNDTGSSADVVMYYDGTIEYFGREHIPYFLVALASLLVVILPPLLLLLYPLRALHRALALLRCQRFQPGGRLELFLNAFYGCFKDGTANTWDWRCFAGLYFIFRIVFSIVSAVEIQFDNKYLIQQILCTVGILLFAICRPYRIDFYNNLDAAMFALLGLINALSSYDYYHVVYGKQPKLLPLEYILIWLPMLYIIAYLVYYVWTTYSLSIKNKLRRLCHKRTLEMSNVRDLSGGGISDDSLLRLVDERAEDQPATPEPRQGDAGNADEHLVLSETSGRPPRSSGRPPRGSLSRVEGDSGHISSSLGNHYGSTAMADDSPATGQASGTRQADLETRDTWS